MTFVTKKTTNEIISQIIYFLISILEKAVVFPMVVLSALTMDLELMKDQPNLRWWGAIILVVCGLKLFRSIFSGKSKKKKEPFFSPPLGLFRPFHHIHSNFLKKIGVPS